MFYVEINPLRGTSLNAPLMGLGLIVGRFVLNMWRGKCFPCVTPKWRIQTCAPEGVDD